MKNLELIINKLPSLNQKELAQVKAVVERLYEPVHANGVDPTVIVFEALTKVLNSKMTYRDLQHAAVYKLWRQHAPRCIVFVEETFPTVKQSKVMQLAVLRFLLEALGENLQSGRIPITIGTMITHLGRVPQIFESSFPNYRESGLTDLILYSMQRHGKTK